MLFKNVVKIEIESRLCCNDIYDNDCSLISASIDHQDLSQIHVNLKRYKPDSQQYTLALKGTVRGNVSDSLWKNGNARFTTVLCKPLTVL